MPCPERLVAGAAKCVTTYHRARIGFQTLTIFPLGLAHQCSSMPSTLPMWLLRVPHGLRNNSSACLLGPSPTLGCTRAALVRPHWHALHHVVYCSHVWGSRFSGLRRRRVHCQTYQVACSPSRLLHCRKPAYIKTLAPYPQRPISNPASIQYLPRDLSHRMHTCYVIWLLVSIAFTRSQQTRDTQKCIQNGID